MCSVRHRPMPMAPNLRARAESAGVSALVRIFNLRPLSSPTSSGWRNRPSCSGGTVGTLPIITSPVVPLIVTKSAGLHLLAGDHDRLRGFVDLDRLARPTTHGLPQPRATTAA